MADATCYRCGQTGHYKAHCPGRFPPTPTTPEATSAPSGLPASYIDIAALRARTITAQEAAELAERYASQVRAARGWGAEDREKRLRALALEQVEESRRGREMWEALGNERKRSVIEADNAAYSMGVMAVNGDGEGS